MRCPYCHVHYLDEEKICPMCGRRAVRMGAGTTSGGTKPKPEKRGKPAKPASSVKRKPSAKQQTATPRPQKQPARPAPVNLSGSGWDTPPEHSSRKKRGCLFPFLILLVLFSVITMIANSSFTGLTQSGFSVSDLIDSLDDSSDDQLSSWYDSPIACMVGTWESQTTGDRITFHVDGSLTVSSGSVSAGCAEDDVFCRVTDSPRALSKDNRDRAADYPPEDYYYCEFSMFPKDEDGGYLDFPTFDLLIFIPRDLYESETPPESGTEIAAFRYDEFDSSADSYLDTYVRQ
ncbi:MAG: SPOR domain-containing protein [Butyricicoccus sp.]|jgi:hypothetical protein